MGVQRTARRSIVAGLISIVAVSMLGVADPPDVQAAFPGAAGRIAWQRHDGTTSHIWTMRSDGSDKVELGVGQAPSWSPDGSKLVFASDSGIEVMDSDGGNRSVVLDHGSWPAWSPDGLKIAFSADTGPGSWDILVMNANGTGVVNLGTSITAETEPSWSPDGTKIAFRMNLYLSGTPTVWVMNADGSNPTNLTPGAIPAYAPDWSPDGSKIAFDSAGIWVMNANGSGKVKVSTAGTEPAWASDGSRIAYTNTDFNDELYSMAANGSNPIRLTNDGATGSDYPEDRFPSWQPASFAITPSPLAFGSGAVGTPTAAKVVTFKAGADPVSVTSVVIDGANAADFQKTSDTCSGALIARLATCAVSVRFVATSVGVRAATLTFSGPAPLGTSPVALSGTGRLFLWGTLHAAGPSYTFNSWRSLASTTSSSTTYLHGLYNGIRVGSSWVSDTGPYAGIYYIRSSNSGSTWTTAKRLNPTSQHGTEPSVASSGSYVYTAWYSQTKWIKYSGTAPRVLYFKRNTNHGSSTAWSTTVRLTSTSGRVDAPTIAASGAYVYVTWTDSVTGNIRVAISANRGATWRQVTIGTTTNSGTSGRRGLPKIAAYGSTLAVAYVSAADHTVKVRTASAYGATWGTTTTIGQTGSPPDISMYGNRIGVTWDEAGGVMVRVATAGVWGASTPLPATDGAAYGSEVQYTPAIALYGTGGIGVAYSACIADCDETAAGVITRSDMIWRQSTNNGATWAPSDTLGSSSSSTSRRQNAWPSIVWKVAKRPYVMWNGWTENTNYFKLYIRAGM